jgi:hypothetical protein
MSEQDLMLKKNMWSDFIRISLLILLAGYIVFSVLDAMDVFVEEINCGAEKIVEKNKKIYFIANGYRFDNANGRSKERALEGEYAVKLTPKNEYGFSITLGTPQAKEVYEGSVWFYKEKTISDTIANPFLVASVGNQFWKGTMDVVETRNGWEKLDFKFTMPDGYYHDPLIVYCWNRTKKTIYFDNMTLKRRNVFKFFKGE